MASNTYVKTYADGASLTEAKLDSALTTLQPDLAQTALLTTGATAGQVLTVATPGAAATWATAADPKGIFGVRNYGLSASTSSGTLTVILKTAAGTNPTASDIVDVTFSSNGSSSAVPYKFQQTSSLSLTVTASATLGVTTATTATLFIYAVRQSSSALRLAISTNGALDTGVAATTVAMAASSDTEGTLYSNASAGTYPTRLLGWLTASHAAGVWNNIYKVNLVNGLSSPNEVSNRRTRSTGTSVGVGGVAISSGSGNFSTTSTSAVSITNMSVTIITTGRPVVVRYEADPAQTQSDLEIEGTSNTVVGAQYSILRGTTTICVYNLIATAAGNGAAVLASKIPVSSVSTTDNVAAGTYTYSAKINRTAATGAATPTARAFHCRLVAYEL